MAIQPEERLQYAVAEYLGWVSRGKAWRWFHIPNGGRMSRVRGARLKRMGVKAGVPDLIIQRSSRKARHSDIQIELKVKGNYQSAEQKAWERESKRLGIPYYVSRSVDEVREVLTRLELV